MQMLESRTNADFQLNTLERRVLKVIEQRSLTEKQISKALRIDRLILYPVITELILKGYLEIYRRRRFYFFSKELCTITLEGITALEASRPSFQRILEILGDKGLELAGALAGRYPALKLAVGSVKTLYKISRALA